MNWSFEEKTLALSFFPTNSKSYCKVNKEFFFSRKTYFYPDLPNGFQITQYEVPVGEKGFLEVDGKKIRITNHSEMRDYYYARNSLYYLKKHRDYLLKKNIYLKLFIKIVKILIFERRKISKLRAICLGIKDGLKRQ